MPADADVAVPAALIGEPARAAMLLALLDGRSLPATELARAARVSPSTASEHLAQLTAGGLTTFTRSGRHRYYTLSGERVARVLEALQVLAPGQPVRSLRQARTGSALAFARSCYDHLAGQLAVQLAHTLTRRAVLAPLIAGERGMLLDAAHPLLAELGLTVPVPGAGSRPMVRGCLDWTERQPHLAGHLGAAVLTALTGRGWLQPAPTSRALHLSDDGRRGLAQILELDPAALRPHC
ncbi:MAG: helix-turn-helix domain-containing protein [Mycobacteriales bacterium]